MLIKICNKISGRQIKMNKFSKKINAGVLCSAFTFSLLSAGNASASADRGGYSAAGMARSGFL